MGQIRDLILCLSLVTLFCSLLSVHPAIGCELQPASLSETSFHLQEDFPLAFVYRISGDANQKFYLPGGKYETMNFKVVVNAETWRRINSLSQAGSAEKVYIVATAQDGRTYIQFGDGLRGARPPASVQYFTIEYEKQTPEAVETKAQPISQCPDISGEWADESGGTIEIMQIGRLFIWTDYSNIQEGLGAINGSSLEIYWMGEYGTHSTTWHLADLNESGAPGSIRWGNKKKFLRTATKQVEYEEPVDVEDIPSESEQPADQPDQGVSGRWKTSAGPTWNITQTGNSFTWTDNSGFRGSGTISGNNITVTVGSASWRGAIVQSDSTGRPSKIRMENGFELVRSASQ